MGYLSSLFYLLSCVSILTEAQTFSPLLDKTSCKLSLAAIDIKEYSPDIETFCVNAVTQQINRELNASIHYLVMGSYFSRDSVNLPGFAKFFLDSASEERQHAIKLMEYLSMRGELISVSKLIKFPTIVKHEWKNGLIALQDAVKLEQSVTASIKNLIKVCEKSDDKKISDYHISDWLTGEYLEEQYKGERDLAGKIFSLKNLKTNRKASKDLAEFIFDKKLLGIDI